MDSQQKKLAELLAHSPAIRLLRSQNGELILSFLQLVFKDANVFLLSEKELHLKLEAFLNHREFFMAETENLSNETRAKQLIKQWTDNSYLRNYYDETSDVIYELTSHTEKVLQWLSNLKENEFIGTESRFKDIMNRLRELMIFSEQDKEKRLQELGKQKEEIEAEIHKIESTGEIETFDDYQIRSRLTDLTRSARELLSDFKEVQDNFDHITRELYRKHANPEYSKESILSLTFDALDSLKETDQGRSFYAFYEFLISRSYQEEWEGLVERLYAALEAKNISYEDLFLKKIKTYLYRNGQKVYTANDRLANKLSKIISEKEIQERVQVKKTIGRIKELYMQISGVDTKPKYGMHLQDLAAVNLFMDKKINLRNVDTPEIFMPPQKEVTSFADTLGFDMFLQKPAVDRKVLLQNVLSLLQEQTQVSLQYVIERYPLQYGLSEILGYFSLLREERIHAIVYDSQQDLLCFAADSHKYLSLPRVVYSK
ncbi:MAG: DUF3375 domain-containing protein [Spirochaetota bacterium]